MILEDNLLILGGCAAGDRGDRQISNAELIKLKTDANTCKPLKLEYSVYGHSSVASSRGIITCGGYTTNFVMTCTLQTNNGETRSFPSMNRSRSKFGMVVMNQTLIIVGGYPATDKMERISMNGDEWIEEDLPFSLWNHCVVSINETTVIAIGGSDYNHNVS